MAAWCDRPPSPTGTRPPEPSASASCAAEEEKQKFVRFFRKLEQASEVLSRACVACPGERVVLTVACVQGSQGAFRVFLQKVRSFPPYHSLVAH